MGSSSVVGDQGAWSATGEDVDEHPSVSARIHVATTSTRMQTWRTPGLARATASSRGQVWQRWSLRLSQRTTSRRAGRDCCSATNGAVCSHPADSRRAIEMDEYEQQPMHDPGRGARCSFGKRASSPAGGSRLFETTNGRAGPASADACLPWRTRRVRTICARSRVSSPASVRRLDPATSAFNSGRRNARRGSRWWLRGS